MGGICVILLSMFCVGWVLCMLFLSCLLPILIIYNVIAGEVCLGLCYYLKRKLVFEKYRDGYKHILSVILKYVLIIYGIIAILFRKISGNPRPFNDRDESAI